MIKAIIYTSKAGHTKEYADILSKKTGLKAFSLFDCELEKGSDVIYMGWIFAGKVKGYANAARKYNVKALCGVGMAPFSEDLQRKLRQKNLGDKPVDFFYLQGGFEINKLSGLSKFIMSLKIKSIRKSISSKDSVSTDDEIVLKMTKEGVSTVTEDKISSVLNWTKNYNLFKD